MNAVVEFPTLSMLRTYSQIEFEFDPQLATLFSWMKPTPRPCFNPKMLEEIQRSERLLELHNGFFNHAGAPARTDYVVFGSRVPGVFNLGGDLDLFIAAILRNDRPLLTNYARLCIDNQYRRASGFGAEITTIALVEGKALGGGFEAALACDLIVAERSATFSLPEMLFNLFPGMGALSFLSRRLGLRKAEEIISSTHVFSAKEMLELNVVDQVVEDGLGLESVRYLISSRLRRQNAYRAIQRAKQCVQPITRKELDDVVDIWVDAALHLDATDRRMMARLVRAQDKLVSASQEDDLLLEESAWLTACHG